MKVIRQKKVPKQKNKSNPEPFFQFGRILVPIDFSDHSKNALKYAIQLSSRFKAAIDLIYVVEPTIYPADFSIGQIGMPNIEAEFEKRGKIQLANLAKHYGENVIRKRIVRTGKPFYEINQYAKEEGIDLIVIATHGHSEMEHILFGSTAEKVVRKAPCPVLVVRKTA